MAKMFDKALRAVLGLQEEMVVSTRVMPVSPLPQPVPVFPAQPLVPARASNVCPTLVEPVPSLPSLRIPHTLIGFHNLVTGRWHDTMDVSLAAGTYASVGEALRSIRFSNGYGDRIVTLTRCPKTGWRALVAVDRDGVHRLWVLDLPNKRIVYTGEYPQERRVQTTVTQTVTAVRRQTVYR